MQFVCSHFDVSMLQNLRRCRYKFDLLANVLLQKSQFFIFSAADFIELNFKNQGSDIVPPFCSRSPFC